jgi:hypothetical protein
MDELLNWNVPVVTDVDMPSAEDSPSVSEGASRRPAALSLGKLLGTGRGSGKLVKLVVVNRVVSCLGYIGNGKTKICLGPKSCKIKSHNREKFTFPDRVQDLVFIEAGGMNPEPSSVGASVCGTELVRRYLGQVPVRNANCYAVADSCLTTIPQLTNMATGI